MLCCRIQDTVSTFFFLIFYPHETILMPFTVNREVLTFRLEKRLTIFCVATPLNRNLILWSEALVKKQHFQKKKTNPSYSTKIWWQHADCHCQTQVLRYAAFALIVKTFNLEKKLLKSLKDKHQCIVQIHFSLLFINSSQTLNLTAPRLSLLQFCDNVPQFWTEWCYISMRSMCQKHILAFTRKTNWLLDKACALTLIKKEQKAF